ncbi:hypothetical protein [Acuticoccus sp. I52.16.1]|uniref:hypothetical protein n=1 Tax=Acuticoccus sp. I52.16.1 TaxID=2928472 RepID=UPI001FD2EAE3|nr:hypothetical protein [Acuticoccus sp. I52.16.1]UOM36734.1 hypothetical protein MRB58_11310 [Acuticoccus sp. I52.16.1]
MTDETTRPPKPRAVIRIGVTGHRVPPKLPASAVPTVEETSVRVLDAVMSAAEAVQRAHAYAFATAPHARLAERATSRAEPLPAEGVIISSLAQGADQIVARLGLDRGWALDAVLPFPPEENDRDFPDPEDRAALHALLDRARARFYLDGRRTAGDGEEKAMAKRAYEAAGIVMLANADILIAIWDGEEAAGTGGTAQIVARAIADGMPVVLIPPQTPNEPSLLWTGFSTLPPQAARVEHLEPQPLDLLGEVVEALLAPPPEPERHRRHMDLAGKLRRFVKSLFTPGEHAHHGAGDPDVALSEYLGERERLQFDWLERRYPHLLAWYGARDFGEGDRQIEPYEKTTRDEWKAFCSTCPPADACRGAIESELLRAFAFADRLGVYYSLRYRGAFVAGYFLAFLAVLLALLAVIPLCFNIPVVKAVLVLAELFIIGYILWIIVQGSAGGWHERWLAYRRLAELLRPMRILALVGALGPVGRPRGRDPDEGFILWYARAIRRMIPVPNAVADSAYLDAVRRAASDCRTERRPVSEIEDQIDYHQRTVGRLGIMDRKLHHWGDVSFKLTFYVGLVYLAAFVGYAALGDGWATEMKDPGTIGYWVKALTTFFMAGLPALGATLSAVRAQAEFAALQAQSQRTMEALALVKAAMDAEKDEPNLALLSDRIERAVDVMQTDLSGWLALSRARPLALPA